MILHTDTNRIIAEMGGYHDIRPGIVASLVGFPAAPGMYRVAIPDYRNSLDAIEPILTRVMPGWAATHNELSGRFGVREFAATEFVFADTLAEAMCAAVLATRVDITPYNAESERAGKYNHEYIARPNEQENDDD